VKDADERARRLHDTATGWFRSSGW
jgi:hypothetical protein